MKELIVVQHVPFEGPGFIEEWAEEKNISVKYVHAWEDDFPVADNSNGVVLMGGPMSVNDDLDFIKKEAIWVKGVLESDIPLLGICLGAQMMAKVLGSKVYKGEEKEIGWFPVYLDENIEDKDLLDIFMDKEEVFHWHGEIFETPENARRLFFNECSPCQGFIYKKAAGFQFHMETTPETAALFVENCKEELQEESSFIQSGETIMKNSGKFKEINILMAKFLDWWAGDQ